MNINFLLILLIIVLFLYFQKLYENFAELENKPPESTLVQSCPDNYTLKDELCYQDSELKCPKDSIFIDEGCYSPDFLETNTCPEYHRLIDDKCYKLEKNSAKCDSKRKIFTFEGY